MPQPLNIAFEVPSPDGSDYQHQIVGATNHRRSVDFTVSANSSINFSYSVACGPSKENQENVTLYFDYISEKLTLLNPQNQSYNFPYRTEIGYMEINSYKQYTAIIQTPAQQGVYYMQWRITSNQITYSFTIYLTVV